MQSKCSRTTGIVNAFSDELENTVAKRRLFKVNLCLLDLLSLLSINLDAALTQDSRNDSSMFFCVISSSLQEFSEVGGSYL